MAVINLRKYYYPIYTKDTFIEVPDEVAEAIIEGWHIEHRQNNKRTYYGVYSLDQSFGMENHVMFMMPSPEDILVQRQENAEHEQMLERLADAMLLLSPTQTRRLRARYVLKKKFREIAEDEGVSRSCATESVTSAVRKLQKFFQKNGWMPKEA